mgnify:FL=1
MAHSQDRELASAERTISTFQWILGLSFSVIVTLTVALAGIWSRNFEREVHEHKNEADLEHREIRATLNARADLPNRTTQLETGQEKLQNQLQQLERDLNRKLR